MANGATPGGRPAPAGPNRKSPAGTVAVLGARGDISATYLTSALEHVA